MIPVAQRVFGESDRLVLGMRQNFALTLYQAPAATLDDLREAVTTLEDAERIARQVLGGAHPLTTSIEREMRNARAFLDANEAPDDETADVSAQEDDADDAARLAALEASITPPPPPTPPPKVGCAPGCFGRSS